MRQVIRADLDPARRPPADPGRRFPRRLRSAREPSRARRKPRKGKPFRRRRRSRPGRGRAEGQGRAIPCSPPAPASRLLDAALRPDPPAAGALRARLALQSAAASAKILRLNADAAALRDLRFAVGDPTRARGEALCRSGAMAPAGRPASTPAGSSTRRRGSTWLCDPNGLALSLKACAGEGDPVSAAAKAAALAFSAFPDAPAPPAEILALWVFDMVLAIRLRWPRPVPLIAMKILDPILRFPGGRTTAKARATQPGQTPPQARSRSPPPPPSTSPPISPAAPTL